MLLCRLGGAVAVHLPSHVQLFVTPRHAARQPPLSSAISQSLLKLMPTDALIPSNHLILCRPPFRLPSNSLSIRVFSDELALHIRWSKYWSLSISPSSEYSGLISIRFDWLDLLAVQGTLKSLLQYQSLEASILWYSDYIMVQLLCPYMTTGNTIGFD